MDTGFGYVAHTNKLLSHKVKSNTAKSHIEPDCALLYYIHAFTFMWDENKCPFYAWWFVAHIDYIMYWCWFLFCSVRFDKLNFFACAQYVSVYFCAFCKTANKFKKTHYVIAAICYTLSIHMYVCVCQLIFSAEKRKKYLFFSPYRGAFKSKKKS